MTRLGRFFVVIVAGSVLLAATLLALIPRVGEVLTAGAIAPAEDIELDPLAQRSVVLADDGSVLTHLLVEENRSSIPLDQVSPTFIDTLLAVEDEHFYEHDGVNVRATARALLRNVSAGGVEQGGSTITQQLVKNALVGSEQSLDRKVEEAVLARRLEDQMSKDEILERYINTVYLGNSTYGVQAAAELYFNVDAVDLDQTQSALLIGLIQNPVRLDPFTNPEGALQRRNEVADRLLAVGQVDGPGAEAMKQTPVPTSGFSISSRPQDYFVEEVKQRLLEDERLGVTQSDRYNMLYRGGLTIRTTLDPRLQALANEAVAEVLPDTEGRFTASIVSIDPRNGAVRAMVGGPGFSAAQYNIATQGPGRQVGSSFKPFVLARILEEGGSPYDRVRGDGPCRFPNPGGTPNPYEVTNFGLARGSTDDLKGQTLRSSNCAYVRLGLIAGLPDVMETANRLGVTTPLTANLASPLGTNSIRPIDMASAYGAFANDGIHHDPVYVVEVLDRNGDVLFNGGNQGERVLDEGVARTVNDILAANVRAGTGTRARFRDGRPAAGKTGTTQDFADAWFVGYTPELSTAVWMGSPHGNEDKMTNVGGIRVTGGSYPARMWQAYMGPALETFDHSDFPSPPPQRRGTFLKVPGETPLRKPTTTTTTTARATTTTAPAPPEPPRSTTTAPAPAPPEPPSPTTTTVPKPQDDGGDGGDGGGKPPGDGGNNGASEGVGGGNNSASKGDG